MSKNMLSEDDNAAVNLTLNSIFKKSDSTTGWILYNDEMPASADRKDNGNLGHTKGVLAFDTATKTANLPVPFSRYHQPQRNRRADGNHQQPQTYLAHMPASLDKSDPLYRLTQPLEPKPAADSNMIDLKSRGGLAFKVIAKNREWGKDFWNDLVGPTLNDDMDVETWIRGPIPPMIDSDDIHKTFDIKFVDLRPLGAPWAWPESKDHAKWGITQNLKGNSPWICVSDINRMISRQTRGGGNDRVSKRRAVAGAEEVGLPQAATGDGA